jgi:hypothetical protein
MSTQIYCRVCAEFTKRFRSGNSDPKKIVGETELEEYLADGWDVQTVLPSGKILIKKV